MKYKYLIAIIVFVITSKLCSQVNSTTQHIDILSVETVHVLNTLCVSDSKLLHLIGSERAQKLSRLILVKSFPILMPYPAILEHLPENDLDLTLAENNTCEQNSLTSINQEKWVYTAKKHREIRKQIN